MACDCSNGILAIVFPDDFVLVPLKTRGDGLAGISVWLC